MNNPMSSTTPSDASTADRELADLVERVTQAHIALMRGDIERYRRLITLADDFVLMSPFGGEPTRGADMSPERWAAMARFFRNGKDLSVELLRTYRTPDMVVLAVIERGYAEVGALPGQHWSLRVTLVFRREGAGWVLAHRHADPLAEGISHAQSAALARGSN